MTTDDVMPGSATPFTRLYLETQDVEACRERALRAGDPITVSREHRSFGTKDFKVADLSQTELSPGKPTSA